MVLCVDIPSPDNFNGLVQDCNDSIANTLELLQSCAQAIDLAPDVPKLSAYSMLCCYKYLKNWELQMIVKCCKPPLP